MTNKLAPTYQEPKTLQNRREQIVSVSRIIIFSWLCSLVFFADWWNLQINHFYRVLVDLGVFTSNLAEPLAVIICFPLFIGMFNYFASRVPSLDVWKVEGETQKKPNIVSSWKKEFRLRLGILRTLLYITPILLFEILRSQFFAHKVPVQAPGALELLAGVLLALFVYDVLFTVGHLAMHKVKKLYKWHAPHHSNKNIQAVDTIELSLPEAAGEVFISILALNLTFAHPLTRLVYDIVIVYLLVELHSGYNLPLSLHSLFPKIFYGGKQHYDHHCYGAPYYCKFFSPLDKVLHSFNNIQRGETAGRKNS
ncbi:MAG: sterol desaturase family protein [Spirochaetota bacterium]